MGNSLHRAPHTDSRPSEEPTDLAGAAHIVHRSVSVLESLRSYEGSDVHIRDACKDPANEDLQLRAADSVTANMQTIMIFYEFSTDIMGIARDLSPKINELAVGSTDAEIVANLILFCFEFDQLKNEMPSLQNNASYYRRIMTASNTSNIASLGSAANGNSGIVSADNAHLAAVWLAKPCSMMSSLFPLSPVSLSFFGNICHTTLQQLPISDEENNRHWLRVWTAVIIIFDRNSPAPGAFTKKSPVKIKAAIKMIHQRAALLEATFLLNCLKYGSVNYNGPGTTKGIHRAFESGKSFAGLFGGG